MRHSCDMNFFVQPEIITLEDRRYNCNQIKSHLPTAMCILFFILIRQKWGCYVSVVHVCWLWSICQTVPLVILKHHSKFIVPTKTNPWKDSLWEWKETFCGTHQRTLLSFILKGSRSETLKSYGDITPKNLISLHCSKFNEN